MCKMLLTHEIVIGILEEEFLSKIAENNGRELVEDIFIRRLILTISSKNF